MSALKKYAKIFSIGFSDMIAWRFGFFMIAFGAVISWIVLLIFWSAVYRAGNTIGSFTLSQLIMYYSFTTVIQIIFDYSFVWDIAEALHEGRLSEYLVKPISYINFLYAKELGARTIAFGAFSIPLACLLYYFRNEIPHEFSTWLLLIVVLIIGFITVSLLGIIAALSSVFFQNPHIVSILFFTVSQLLSGRTIPFSIMPTWLATIAQWSPFPFISGVPTEFLLGIRTGLSAQEIVVNLAWVIILIFMARKMWRYSATKYEAGGS